MKTLIEDYERRLATITEVIETTKDTGSRNDIAKMARLNAKQSEYRTFISELEREVRKAEEAETEEIDKISTHTRLYYRYKKTSDDKIVAPVWGGSGSRRL